MKSTPTVSEEEIRERMNFDALLTMRKTHRRQHLKRNSILSAVLLTGAVVLTYWINANDTQLSEAPQQNPPAADSIAVHQSQPKVETKTLSSPNPEAKQSRIKAVELPAKTDVVATSADVYLEAEPLRGYPDLYAYFDRELKYPQVAIKDSIQGTESVSFFINKEGKPEGIVILHSLGSLFDEESRRLIINMPSWKPASLNGQPVRAKITIPLTFTITHQSTHP